MRAAQICSRDQRLVLRERLVTVISPVGLDEDAVDLLEIDGADLVAHTRVRSEGPLGERKGLSLGDGWVFVREQKKSPDAPGMSGLCGHLFGGARRTVVLVRAGGGLGDAGNEAMGQQNARGKQDGIARRRNRESYSVR